LLFQFPETFHQAGLNPTCLCKGAALTPIGNQLRAIQAQPLDMNGTS
jgi:hypothetical protein